MWTQIGDVFVVLFAGHGESVRPWLYPIAIFMNDFIETTGHTLAATLGFLGIYQEEQDIVYEQIMDVIGNDRDPVGRS